MPNLKVLMNWPDCPWPAGPMLFLPRSLPWPKREIISLPVDNCTEEPIRKFFGVKFFFGGDDKK